MQADTAWESLHSESCLSDFPKCGCTCLSSQAENERIGGAAELTEGRLHRQGLKSDCQDPQTKCRTIGNFWKAETNRKTSSTLMERVITAAEAGLRPATRTQESGAQTCTQQERRATRDPRITLIPSVQRELLHLTFHQGCTEHEQPVLKPEGQRLSENSIYLVHTYIHVGTHELQGHFSKSKQTGISLGLEHGNSQPFFLQPLMVHPMWESNNHSRARCSRLQGSAYCQENS